ncbi:MAG: DNA methyltransferase [Pseudohongiellaceae bacterium]
MNAIEIEEAISELAEQPFDAAEFPYAFLEAFGNKATTIKRLRSGSTNASDIDGAVLQRNHIHIGVSEEDNVSDMLRALKESPATSKAKAKFILATDGKMLEAEDLTTGDTIACKYPDFPDHFGTFLPLAGISTVKQIRDNAFDIKATARLNRLYVQLLRDNPKWGTADRRHDMNHFMARLIFCFFAEDTDIFNGDGLFTATIEKMSARDSSNTDEVISELFRAMNTNIKDRGSAKLPRWADAFPYVNGGLFSDDTAVPKFTRIARSYLFHIGRLDWQKINPDIFGSMIQAVADDEERGSLGMHYTSVPNILKVLNPLFLDDLREQLDAAGKSPQKLLNLRKRMSKIRVFDPACGSGNFLVIAYKEMRKIEAEVNARRGESDRKTDIPLTNFRGIELRDFSAEIARLALIIAEYQCDVLYRGQKEALKEFLPLNAMNWITCGNALRLDWLSICPPTGTGVKHHADDLFHSPLNQAQIDFDNEGGETYICGNPPYIGDKKQTPEQKSDIKDLLADRTKKWKSLDYVCGWFVKAADYGINTEASSAFVSTNSISQGQQVSVLWPLIFGTGHQISFAHTSFKWRNLASHNAGVTVVIIGISKSVSGERKLFTSEGGSETMAISTPNISPYLAPGKTVFVESRRAPISNVSEMVLGNFAKDGGNLLLDHSDLKELDSSALKFVRPMFGGQEFIKSNPRFCFWVDEASYDEARNNPILASRFEKVRDSRLSSPKKATREWADRPYRFVEVRSPNYTEAMVLPIVSSENREYFPVGFLPRNAIVNYAFGLYDAPLWNMALIASRLHLSWIATVCGKMKTDYRYSNTLGWNTFPVPKLTEKNKEDLTRCAEDILLAREKHFPATIADLYDPEKMPEDLRHAHERNDEVLERIYIGRRFRNDTERLEKLFDLYTKMTTKAEKAS